MDSLRELLQSVRSLRRKPGLAIAIIATLALGIGSTTAMFSIIDSVLLKPLPLPESGRLMVIEESKNGEISHGNPQRLNDWSRQLAGIEGATGFYSERVVWSTGGSPERVEALRSFGSFLKVLGIAPLRGRAFTEAEEAGVGQGVAILTESFLIRRFGRDTDVLGQNIQLSDLPYVIIGVAQLPYPEGIDVILPAPLAVQKASRKASFLETIVRLRQGVKKPEISAQIATVAARLRTQYPQTDGTLSARPISLLDHETSGARTQVVALMAAVGFLLLTGCVNIAGLLLARAAERRKEAAIRMSLGSGRWGLIRLYAFESLVLAIAGGAAGLGVAAFGLEGLKRILPGDLPRLATASLDWRVALFALAASLLCAVLFGLAPAWAASTETSFGAASVKPRDRSGFQVRKWFVAAQVALSMVLLAGAGLLGETLLRMERVPLGFTPAHLLTVNINFPWDAPDSRVEEFRNRALESFSAMPGVASVGWGDRLPMAGGTQSGPILIRNRELPPALAEEQAYHRAASASYFETLGIPLKSGRVYREAKHEAVINEELLHKYFPAGDAIGRYVTFDVKPKPGRPQEWFEIVGVVGSVRQGAADESAPPEVYVSGHDISWPLTSFVLRVRDQPAPVIAALRDQVRRIDPHQVVDSIAPMDERLSSAVEEPRSRWWLVCAFAFSALILASMGIYGVLASEVVARTREIGIRMAVGARPREVQSLMIRGGMIPVLFGIAAGVAVASMLTRYLKSLLFGIQPLDPGVFLAACLTLLAAALTASFIPARRAANLDPALAMRRDAQ
jgi:predicted permease